MKWLILLTLFACSHQKSESTAQVEKPQASEKPISPLTVKPCYCMKIFQPVCAGGVNYGNSCEAECNGHKTWKDGSCPATKK